MGNAADVNRGLTPSENTKNEKVQSCVFLSTSAFLCFFCFFDRKKKHTIFQVRHISLII